MKRVFKRSNLTPVGMMIVLIGISCDPDRSSIPAMVAILVIGCALCLIGSHGRECDYEENIDSDYDCYDCNISGNRACR